MKITKGEAIALNLWDEIKEIYNIKEGTRENIELSLGKLYPLPNGASFSEEVKLWTEFPPGFEFDLSSGRVLILSKNIQERETL